VGREIFARGCISMAFASIQGQDLAVSVLRNALEQDRLAHAYLFIGPAGVGKKKAAVSLVQALLCRREPHKGCGTCAACASVVAGTHPDFLFVAPESGKQSLVIDQVRELQRLLSLKPVLGGKKIAVLDDAHLLTAQAQSALLKLVEEPPGDSLLILLTVNSATLSRPLLSRCQQIRFSALPLSIVETLLVQDHGKDETVARALALYSRGSIGRALLLDPEVFTEERRYVEEELPKIGKAPFASVSRFAEWLVADRVRKSATNTNSEDERPTGDRLELVLSWCEEVLRCAVLGPEGVVRHRNCLPVLAPLADRLGVAGALRQLSLVYDTIQALGRNANRQLAVEDMLLQLGAEG
jgi:DNA polymerase-3 subunit delta'